MRGIAAALVLIIVIAFGCYRADQTGPSYTCGNVSGGAQWTDAGVDLFAGFGDWVHDLASKRGEDRRDQIEKAVQGVFRKVLLVWLKAMIHAGRGWKTDPEVLRLQQKAKAERAEAERQCTPCPTTDPRPDQEGSDPRTYLATSATVRAGQYDPTTVSIMRTWITVGQQQGIGRRGWVLIAAAGMQESGGGKPRIRLLDYGHSSSVGPLQLIDTHGTKAQRMDPAFAGRWFYTELRKVDGWADMPLTEAVQAVQRSAHPSAYAKWETDADKLVTLVAGGNSEVPAGACSFTGGESTGRPASSTAGSRTITDPWSDQTYTIPLPADQRRRTAINFALDQLGDPYVWAAHGPDAWDCSGLVSGAWKAAGVDVYPQTEVMVRQEGHVQTPQPGDIVYKPGHAQLWLGVVNGQELIVEAPRTGRPVMVRAQWMRATAYLDPTAQTA